MYSGSHTTPPQTTPESGNLRPWKEVKNLPVSPDFSVRTRQQREAGSSKVVSCSRHRSTTASVSRRTYFADAELAPLPVGLALLEEGARAFLEVLAQMAREGDEHAAADGVAAEHGERRLGHAGDAAEHARDARLVAERVLLRLEAQELADVGAADERLVPGPGEDHHADGRIRIELRAEVVQRLVHLEGHGVARLGPVEGD